MPSVTRLLTWRCTWPGHGRSPRDSYPAHGNRVPSEACRVPRRRACVPRQHFWHAPMFSRHGNDALRDAGAVEQLNRQVSELTYKANSARAREDELRVQLDATTRQRDDLTELAGEVRGWRVCLHRPSLSRPQRQHCAHRRVLGVRVSAGGGQGASTTRAVISGHSASFGDAADGAAQSPA